ncbi:MAG: T9SS type A sorting domain-containing protein [Flavobacteriales bacterium]|nr:T9SS type A sorting domain-containing protein [Flavobacteriales bacterium]
MRTKSFLNILFIVIFASTGTAQDWQWMKHIGGLGRDFNKVSASDEVGNVYVVGVFEGACLFGSDPIQEGDAYIAKLDPAGALIWLKTCSSPTNGLGFADLIVDSVSQSLYVVGSYEGSCILDTVTLYAGNFAGALLARWTYEGSCLWAKNIATSSTDLFGSRCYGRSLAMMPDGEIIVSGTTTEYAQTFVQGVLYDYGAFISAYDANGTSLWARQYLTQNSSVNAFQVALISHGPRVYAGVSYGLNSQADSMIVDTTVLVGGPIQGYLLSRIDPFDGSSIWMKHEGIGGTFAIAQQPMAFDQTGRLAVVGLLNDTAYFGSDTIFNTNSNFAGSFIAIHDTTGEVLTAHAYEAASGVLFENVEPDPFGGFYVSGTIWPSTNNWDGVSFQITDIREIFISRHAPDGSCQAVFTDGSGRLNTTSLLSTADGLYLGLKFPDEQENGTVTLGNSSFTSYGYQDAIIAKLDQFTGVSAIRTEEPGSLRIYANPNNGLCTVELPENLRFTHGLNLAIYDVQGRQVQHIPVSTSSDGVRLDISAQAKGMYHVELGDGQQRYTGTIVFE